MRQTIICQKGSAEEVEKILNSLKANKVLFVKDSSYPYLAVGKVLDAIAIAKVDFNDFTPNPLYEQIMEGVALFNREHCDAIVAIGGGSSIDVAKCIKLFAKMDLTKNCLDQEFFDSGIPLIALPTTAGTGSESTRYAVCYFEGKKQSVTHSSIIPDYAVLDSTVLDSLPLYQKKCTMLDALCQAIESWWSVNSTEESQKLSKEAIRLLTDNYKAYIFDSDPDAADKIMRASNLAGRAINITQTTAAHAMSYKLTSLYRLPHGHAVALCLPYVWKYMIDHPELCIDKRGEEYLKTVFSEISDTLGQSSADNAVLWFSNLLKELEMTQPVRNDDEEIDLLTVSVNPVRLKNNPVLPDAETIHKMYDSIVLKPETK